MADLLIPNEGKHLVGGSGLPATVYFGLSTRKVGAGLAHAVTDTLAGGVGEITGTGYTRKSQAEPSPVAGVWTFAEMSWLTDVATDWPETVRSFFAATTADNTGVVLWFCNLVAGGTAHNMAAASLTLAVTPTFRLQNEDGT